MLPLLFSALFLLGHAGQTSPAPAATKTYRNEELHFTYTYPAAFGGPVDGASVMADAKKESDDATKKIFDCISAPLFGTNAKDENSFELLMMLRVDFDCLKAPADPSSLGLLATSQLKQGLAKLGPATVGEPATYKLDGHDAAFARGEAAMGTPSSPAYGGTTCTLVEHTAVCWTAVVRDKARLPMLLASQVTFGDHAGQPLVPADVIGKAGSGK